MNDPLDVEMFRAIVESSVDAVAIINRGGDIVFWNDAAELMFGYSETEVLGKYVHDILPAYELRKQANESFGRFQREGISSLAGKLLQVKGLKKSGEIMDVQFSFNTITFQNKLFAYAFLRDISDLISLQNKLEKLASIDELTNIYNRRAFMNLFEKAFSFAKRHNTSYCVLMLDIDLFKKINDDFGHDAGDTALRMFSNTTSSVLREEDIFGRVGGEEFCIILPNTKSECAFIVAEKIRKAIYGQAVRIENESFNMSVSIGLSVFEYEDSSSTDSRKRADQALYKAKRTGRNKVADTQA